MVWAGSLALLMSPIGNCAPTSSRPRTTKFVLPLLIYIVIIQWAHQMVTSFWDDQLSIRASIVRFPRPSFSVILGIYTMDSHCDYSAIIVGLTSVLKTHSQCDHWGSYRGSYYLSNNRTLSSQKAWHNDTEASSITYWTLGGMRIVHN